MFRCTAGTELPATRKTTNDKKQTAMITATKTTTPTAEETQTTAAATVTSKTIRKIASKKP